jgi:hypothetical protein
MNSAKTLRVTWTPVMEVMIPMGMTVKEEKGGNELSTMKGDFGAVVRNNEEGLQQVCDKVVHVPSTMQRKTSGRER